MVNIKCEQSSNPWLPAIVYHNAVVIKDKMYILCGIRDGKSTETTVYMFDLNNYTWSAVEPKGKIPSTRCLCSAVAIGDKIYVFGGYQIAKEGTHKCFNGMYCYDTQTNTWEHLPSSGICPEPRAGASMVLHNGKLYVYGGSQGRHIFYGDLYEYTIETKTWKKVETTGVFPRRRTCHTANVMGDKMYVFGGITADFEFKDQKVVSELISFDFVTGEWHEVKVNKPPEARCCHCSISMMDDLLICCGGDLLAQSTAYDDILDEDPDYCNDMLVYNTKSNTWRTVKENQSTLPHVLGNSIVYDPFHHRLLMFGGKLSSGMALKSLHSASFSHAGGFFALFNKASRALDEELETKLAQQDTFNTLTEDNAPNSPRLKIVEHDEKFEFVEVSPGENEEQSVQSDELFKFVPVKVHTPPPHEQQEIDSDAAHHAFTETEPNNENAKLI